MKKRSLIVAILFCVFSHIYAEGYIGYTFFDNNGKVPICMKLCYSPTIKHSYEINKFAQSGIEDYRKAAENFPEPIYINVTLCQKQSESIYSIVKFCTKKAIEVAEFIDSIDGEGNVLTDKTYDDPYVAQYDNMTVYANNI